MEVGLLVCEDELSQVRPQVHGLVIQRQEEYDVLILVYTVLYTPELGSALLLNLALASCLQRARK